MTIQRNHFPTPICQMGAWEFWASGRALGLSQEDIEAIDDGTATADQQVRSRAAVTQARETLILLPPGMAVVPPAPPRMRPS